MSLIQNMHRTLRMVLLLTESIICMDPWRGHIILFVTFIIAHGVSGDKKLIHKWNAKTLAFFSYLPQFKLFYIVRYILFIMNWQNSTKTPGQRRVIMRKTFSPNISCSTRQVNHVTLCTKSYLYRNHCGTLFHNVPSN